MPGKNNHWGGGGGGDKEAGGGARSYRLYLRPAPLTLAASQPGRPPCSSQLLADLRHHLGFGLSVTGSGKPELT